MKMLSFYLYSSRKFDMSAFLKSLGHIKSVLEKFDFFSFYEKEIFDQNKRKVVVLRFFKMMELDKSTRKVLVVFYKNCRDLDFMRNFIVAILQYYADYEKITKNQKN